MHKPRVVPAQETPHLGTIRSPWIYAVAGIVNAGTVAGWQPLGLGGGAVLWLLALKGLGLLLLWALDVPPCERRTVCPLLLLLAEVASE